MTPIPGAILEFKELPSTQDKAAELLQSGENVGVVFAEHQSKGRGRFQREWVSQPGDSMTASFVFTQYPDHPQPWLIGMSLALAVAGTLRTQLQWPNDVTIGGKKLGGILTELHTNDKGQKIPVIGVGLNLNQTKFPQPIGEFATSLAQQRDSLYDARTVLQTIHDAIEATPEPDSWECLEPAWMLFDDTPGKLYKLPDGKEATAIGLGPNGQLICAVEGETQSVLAAEAIFGS